MKTGSRSRGPVKKDTKEVLKPVDDRLDFMYSLDYFDLLSMHKIFDSLSNSGVNRNLHVKFLLHLTINL